jgi:AraC-like DNA-binding protein
VEENGAVSLGFTMARWETERGVHELATRPGRGAAGPMVTRYAGYTEHSTAFRRREVPGPGVGLVLAFGDPLIAEDGSRLGAFAFGNQTTASLSTVFGHQAGVQIDLTPLGARSLLGVEPAALTNAVVPLEVALGPFGLALLDQLASAPSWAVRFDLIDAAVAGVRAVALTPEVDWVANQLARTKGRARIEELVNETGWSPRHFGRRFLEQIGLSPKTYARLVRFDHAVGLVRARRCGTLAEVAAKAGFFDQAHFNRECRSFAGCTPSELVAELDPEPEVRFVQDDEEGAPVRSWP